MKNIQSDRYTQKDFFAKTIDFFFFFPNVWDKGVGVLVFGLYKELCVCVRAEMCEYVIDSHIFKVWMFGDNVSEHA